MAKKSDNVIMLREYVVKWSGKRLDIPGLDPRNLRGPSQVYTIATGPGIELHRSVTERMIVLFVDDDASLLGWSEVAHGGKNAVSAAPREVFRLAVAIGASGIVLVHNHPTGDATPSAPDLEMTERIAKVGDIIGIELLDHVVIGDGEFTTIRNKARCKVDE